MRRSSACHGAALHVSTLPPTCLCDSTQAFGTRKRRSPLPKDGHRRLLRRVQLPLWRSTSTSTPDAWHHLEVPFGSETVLLSSFSSTCVGAHETVMRRGLTPSSRSKDPGTIGRKILDATCSESERRKDPPVETVPLWDTMPVEDDSPRCWGHGAQRSKGGRQRPLRDRFDRRRSPGTPSVPRMSHVFLFEWDPYGSGYS